MKPKQSIFRVAGILIALSLAFGAQAEDVALAEPAAITRTESAPAAIAQTESAPIRIAQTGNSRPVTLDDLRRFEERMNERFIHMDERMDHIDERMNRIENRMDRIEGKIDTQGGRLDLALTVMLGGLLGLVAALIVILLPRREKPVPAPVHLSRDAGKTPPATAH